MTGRDALRRLLSGDEGQYFERKSLLEGPPTRRQPRDRKTVRDEIAQYVAAFANADGGTLVLGAEDDGTVTGHAYPQRAVDEMLLAARDRDGRPAAPTRPRCAPPCETCGACERTRP